MLAGCPDCQDGKTYDRYHKATAHLRQRHFDLPKRSTLKPGGLQGPRTATPICTLKNYIEEVQIEALEKDVEALKITPVH